MQLDRRGIVKWYDKVKGYGFIVEANNPNDIFVHVSGLANAKTLDQGDVVVFNTDEGRRGEKAIDVIIINS